ncbi:MSMEG_4193 family putative phosphomutase [Georgenia sp. H159]|uniref:MSMEG_4193 family putative phosphomutase n=1 Tax=Georgenia sp. H159 TaxID=3076115 RepID=UPI002D787CA1|nr:MSMEG_4193 family putative phosphomutase [Georgenia sp. H159]
MATVILVRHARSTANTAGVLAGRTPGVELDATGREQAERNGARLRAVPLVGVLSSPLDRCRQTAQAIVDHQDSGLTVRVEEELTECDYGRWQGRALTDLAREELWSVVQRQPSAAVFPGGESLPAMAARAVSAVRRVDAAVEAEHGPGAVWAAVTHGDLVKAILADALGLHLDLFQRLHVHPASASIVRYTPTQPHVVAMNTDAGDLSWLRARANEPPVGGGAGPAAPAPAS